MICPLSSRDFFSISWDFSYRKKRETLIFSWTFLTSIMMIFVLPNNFVIPDFEKASTVRVLYSLGMIIPQCYVIWPAWLSQVYGKPHRTPHRPGVLDWACRAVQGPIQACGGGTGPQSPIPVSRVSMGLQNLILVHETYRGTWGPIWPMDWPHATHLASGATTLIVHSMSTNSN